MRATSHWGDERIMRARLEPKRRSAYLMAAIGTFVTIAIIGYPEEAFKASLNGLRVWWDIVFPALLPFFIASEVLMGLGVVHFIGALLEPLMRPVFNVPGVGAFAFAMGLASGYPIGSKITARLRREGLCSRVEGERLVSFTNTADPLFMIGAVAVGMFGNEKLGFLIAAAHYISAVILGIGLRFYGMRDPERPLNGPARREPMLSRAFSELYRARKEDGRSFGHLFGDSIRDSINTLLLIGGYIMMFSVTVRVLTLFGLTKVLGAPLALILEPLGLSRSLVPSVISGTFEITIGSELASRAAAPLIQRAAMASAIIAWSGLSVLAQVAAMTQGTDIRIGPYVIARVFHAALAAIITIVLWRPLLGSGIGSELPTMSFAPGYSAGGAFGVQKALATLAGGASGVITALAILAVLAAVTVLFRGVRVTVFKVNTGRHRAR